MVGEDKPVTPSEGSPQDALRRKRLLPNRKQMYMQIAAAMVILFCGIIIGSGAALLHFKDRIVRDRRPPLGAIVEDIRTRYGLTEDQTERAEEILGESRERMHKLFDEFRQKTEAEFQTLSAAMKEVLSPEQYERWQNDFRTRRRPGPPGRGPGRFGPGGPGPGPGRFERRRFGPGRPGAAEPNAAPE